MRRGIIYSAPAKFTEEAVGMIFENEKERLTVGKKQVIKAIEENNVQKVFLASDCDKEICDKIESLVKSGTEVYYIPTMKELGAMCSIDVGASCAAVKKY